MRLPLPQPIIAEAPRHTPQLKELCAVMQTPTFMFVQSCKPCKGHHSYALQLIQPGLEVGMQSRNGKEPGAGQSMQVLTGRMCKCVSLPVTHR